MQRGIPSHGLGGAPGFPGPGLTLLPFFPESFQAWPKILTQPFTGSENVTKDLIQLLQQLEFLTRKRRSLRQMENS